jgi:hypothetical protein
MTEGDLVPTIRQVIETVPINHLLFRNPQGGPVSADSDALCPSGSSSGYLSCGYMLS